MDTPQIYYYKNDTLLEVSGLSDEATDAYINNATITAVVKDKDGAQVAGQSWPLTLAYVAASDGDYRGVLEDTLAVEIGDSLMAEVTIDGGSGRKAFWRMPVKVRQRGKVYYY